MSRRPHRLLLALSLAAAAMALAQPLAAKRKGRKAKAAPEAPAPVAEAPPGVHDSGLPVLPSFPPASDALVGEVVRLVDALNVDDQRAEARKQLIALGHSASPVLARFFADSRFTVRWEMVNVQGDARDPRLVPYLVDRALRDEDPHVRWRALWAINEHEDRSEAARLARAAMVRAKDGIQWNAAVALSMIGTPDCLPLIHAGLRRADPWQRWEAINALGRVHDATSVAQLVEVLPSLAGRDRNEAALVLGLIGGPAATSALVGLLSDPEPGVRWRAAMGLGQGTDASALPALETLLATETDPLVRDHAERARNTLRDVAASTRPKN